MKDVDFEDVVGKGDDVARLFDDDGLAERHERASIVEGYGPFPFKSRRPRRIRGTFDRQKSLVIADANADCSFRISTDLPLCPLILRTRLAFERSIALDDEEFSFDFTIHGYTTSSRHRISKNMN